MLLDLDSGGLFLEMLLSILPFDPAARGSLKRIGASRPDCCGAGPQRPGLTLLPPSQHRVLQLTDKALQQHQGGHSGWMEGITVREKR